jgi:hypothetical protein
VSDDPTTTIVPADRHTIPVDAARQVAEHCELGAVVIVGFEPTDGREMMYACTYGQTPQQKLRAAAYGDVVKFALSSDPDAPQTFSDFRLVTAAEAKRTIDALRAALKALADEAVKSAEYEDWPELQALVARARELSADGGEAAPIPMVLHCPKCGRQHVDAPEAATGWTNPPHRSHQCAGCATVWRPADVPTTGVDAVATNGKADTWP